MTKSIPLSLGDHAACCLGAGVLLQHEDSRSSYLYDHVVLCCHLHRWRLLIIGGRDSRRRRTIHLERFSRRKFRLRHPHVCPHVCCLPIVFLSCALLCAVAAHIVYTGSAALCSISAGSMLMPARQSILVSTQLCHRNIHCSTTLFVTWWLAKGLTHAKKRLVPQQVPRGD